MFYVLSRSGWEVGEGMGDKQTEWGNGTGEERWGGMWGDKGGKWGEGGEQMARERIKVENIKGSLMWLWCGM